MITQVDIVEDIIRELMRIKSIPLAARADDDHFPLPRMINAGNGGSLFISRKLDEGIAHFSRRLMDDEPSLKVKYTQAEWGAIVRRAFGPALASIDLDDAVEANASCVLTSVKNEINLTASSNGVREYAFGCTLLGGTGFKPFRIGPVLFETREIWLERKFLDGGVSALSQRRIE